MNATCAFTLNWRNIVPKKDPVAKSLEDAAKLFNERSLLYGNTYKEHGDVVDALFPEGILIETPEDHSRFACITMIVSKLKRYTHNFENGGHEDSLDDISVYAQMLKELDK